nr:putative ribonuclease H-like domain-containing protein [Tanacetum cinerariifolium]
MAAALSLSLFLQIVCGRYRIQIPFRRSSRAVRTSLIIIWSHRNPIQVLVAMPLYNLEFCDNDDSSLGVVERRNRTLVEAARTMLSAAKVPLFFWAEA